MGNNRLFRAKIWVQKNWICVGRQGGRCRSLHWLAVAGVSILPFLLHVPNRSCTLAETERSRSTVTSKPIGFNSRQKSFSRCLANHLCPWWMCKWPCLVFFALIWRSAHGTCISSSSDMSPFLCCCCSQFRCSVESFHLLCCGSLQMLITMALPVFSYCCITWLHFRFQLTSHTCYWFDPKIFRFWQTADKRLLINIAFQLKYVVSVKSSWDIVYIFSSQARGRLLH